VTVPVLRRAARPGSEARVPREEREPAHGRHAGFWTPNTRKTYNHNETIHIPILLAVRSGRHSAYSRSSSSTRRAHTCAAWGDGRPLHAQHVCERAVSAVSALGRRSGARIPPAAFCQHVSVAGGVRRDIAPVGCGHARVQCRRRDDNGTGRYRATRKKQDPFVAYRRPHRDVDRSRIVAPFG
jgi:hypothetical protein